jgi:hypothetical protein
MLVLLKAMRQEVIMSAVSVTLSHILAADFVHYFVDEVYSIALQKQYIADTKSTVC